MEGATTDKEVKTPLEVRKLQKHGRVDVPTEMHHAMGSEVGDKVFVKWDEDDEVIKLMPADPKRLE